MTIVKRLVKGSALTAAEFDGNMDDLVAQIAAKAAAALTLTAGAGLTGGGNLGADRAFAVTPASKAEVQARTESAKPVAPDQLKPLEHVAVALSDMTTALTTGTNKAYWRAPYAFRLTDLPQASAFTAPSGAAIIVDINVAGSTILSTKLSIAAGSKTSVGGTAPVVTAPLIAAGSEVTFDIDQVGSGVAGAGLIAYLLGHRE